MRPLLTCEVPRCRNQVPPGVLVCGDHGNDLAFELLLVPSLALALEAAHTKQMRFDVQSPIVAPPSEDESPLPFNGRASTARDVLHETLRAWAAVVADERGVPRPSETTAAMGPWLAASVSWLRTSPLGPEAVPKILGAIAAANRVVDRPADLRYAGPCYGRVPAPTPDDPGATQSCGAQLYAERGVHVVTCKVCGREEPIADRRALLLRQAEAMVLPATELARAIGGLGVEVTPSMIRNWRARGDLPVASTRRRRRLDGGVDEVPLYRVGDVLDRVDAGRRPRREAV